jgi:hypothetical protein
LEGSLYWQNGDSSGNFLFINVQVFLINNSETLDQNNPLRINITKDLAIDDTNTYFILDNNNINPPASIGNIVIDGGNHTVYINDVSEFKGLFRNGEGDTAGTQTTYGIENIIIQNIKVDGYINPSTLYCDIHNNIGGGWVAQSFFQYGDFINCSSKGNIGLNTEQLQIAYVGGIIGAYAANNGTVNATSCHSNDDIIYYSGGIFGAFAGLNNGIINATSCYSNGNVIVNSGGIFGYGAGIDSNNGVINVKYCYSNGLIIDTASGGIFGLSAGGNINTNAGGTIIVENCHSVGKLYCGSGGIFGYGAGGSSNNKGANISVISCYSTGDLYNSSYNYPTNPESNSGGIFGESCGSNSAFVATNKSDMNTITVTNCYSTGIINAGGGIFADNASYGGSGGVNCFGSNIIVNSCYSTGAIYNGGGIFAQYASKGGNATITNDGGIGGDIIITNCYSTGDIYGDAIGGIFAPYACIGGFTTLNLSLNNSGGIFGAFAAIGGNGEVSYKGGNGGTININNCYSAGNMIFTDIATIINITINNNNYGDGGNIIIKNCYSTGTINESSGGIFGSLAAAGLYDSNNLTSSNGGTIDMTNCYTTGIINNIYIGGIFGSYAANGKGLCGSPTNIDGTITIKKCFSLGGSDTNGIFGNTPNLTNCTLTKSFSKNSDGKTITFY